MSRSQVFFTRCLSVHIRLVFKDGRILTRGIQDKKDHIAPYPSPILPPHPTIRPPGLLPPPPQTLLRRRQPAPATAAAAVHRIRQPARRGRRGRRGHRRATRRGEKEVAPPAAPKQPGGYLSDRCLIILR